jgi:hypothetical protein
MLGRFACRSGTSVPAIASTALAFWRAWSASCASTDPGFYFEFIGPALGLGRCASKKAQIRS